MKPVQTIEDVYPALEELKLELKAAGCAPLQAILDHRMHQVAWTTRAELFEELNNILTKALGSHEPPLPEALQQQIGRVLLVVRSFLDAAM